VSSPSVPGEFFGVQGGWDYQDTMTWKTQYPQCGGQAQSPVRIDPGMVTASDPAEVETLQFSYSPVSNAVIVNSGHAIEVRGPFGTLTLPDGEYKAAEFRFHFPPEHTMQGSQDVGELQIIHERPGGAKPGLAIISIRLIVAIVEEAQKNFFTNIGFGKGRVLPGRTAQLESKQAVDLNVFRDELTGSYYHYQGSLTLPPCLEQVHWYILEDPVAIGVNMLESFKALFPDPGNSRPVQPLNDRRILKSRIALPNEFPGAVDRRPARVDARPVREPRQSVRLDRQPVRGSQEFARQPGSNDDPYDCDAGLLHWRQGWSRTKKNWCCDHTRKGCSHYTCEDTTNLASWGPEQRDFCCEKHSVGCAFIEVNDWSYAEPDKWSFEYPSCIGTQQSPISIDTDSRRGSLGKIQHLTISYEPVGGLKLENTGHLLRVSGPFGRFALPDGMYEAKEIRFHFPSEHKMGGVLAAGEMQIVHQRRGASGDDDLAIVSILLQVSSGGTRVDQAQLDFFSNLGFGRAGALPAKGAAGVPIPLEVDLEVFRDMIRGRYFHYEGSLTEPPCSETVHWYVVEQPSVMRMEMVTDFKEIFPDPANNRPVQPLTDRVVTNSQIKVKDTCEYRSGEGCQDSGGITGWFQGILGQSNAHRLELPAGRSTPWWLVICGTVMATSVLLVRAVQMPRRDRYQALLSQDARSASAVRQFGARLLRLARLA